MSVLWAQAHVAVLDLESGNLVARWPTKDHLCEMVLNRSGDRLFVANANRNTVTVFDADTGQKQETIWAALYPQSPPGSTPNRLALSRDEQHLFVANACNNVVAVFDASHRGKSRSLGFIPTGWYPTSVRVSSDGKKLLVANGKGIISKANPLGPQPGVTLGTNRTEQYIAGLFKGTLGVIELPEGKPLEKQMRVWTAQALACSPRPEEIDESRVAAALYTSGLPDPDLLIRTSGEMRLSNFLLWQVAYTELWVTKTLWPDFGARELCLAVADFQRRHRRFGGV